MRRVTNKLARLMEPASSSFEIGSTIFFESFLAKLGLSLFFASPSFSIKTKKLYIHIL